MKIKPEAKATICYLGGMMAAVAHIAMMGWMIISL
jgi:hypothetical protein